LPKTEIEYNYEVNKKVEYKNLLLITTPKIVRLKYEEKTCPEAHKIKMVKAFAVDEDFCPIHGEKLLSNGNQAGEIELVTFKAVDENKNEIYCFAPKEIMLDGIDIYYKFNGSGYDVSVAGKKNMSFVGVLLTEIKAYKQEIQETSNLTPEEAIQMFMSYRPPLKYPDYIQNNYKHALLLASVHIGLNILVIGTPGTLKTETALALKEITGGAFVDVPNATTVGVIGSTSRNSITGQDEFTPGAIFDARDNLLLVDEIDKAPETKFFQVFNSLIANHAFEYRKGQIKYFNDDFYISFIGFGNPIGTFFNTTPIIDIRRTFAKNKEFLSRMHLMFALKSQGKPELTDFFADTSTVNKALHDFVMSRRKIQVLGFEPDAKEEMLKFRDKKWEEYNELRFDKNLVDLCIAEAKFNGHEKITLKDVINVEQLYATQDALLYDKVFQKDLPK